MKKRRTGFIVVTVIAALLVAGVVGVELRLRHAIRGAVENALSGTGAQVELGRMSVSLPRRSVTVHDIRIKAQDRDLARHGFTVISADVSLGSISVHGIGYKKADGKPALSAEGLVIRSPRLALVTKDAPGTSENKKPAGPRLSDRISSLKIGTVSVTGAAIDYVRWLSDAENTRVVLGGGNVTMTGFSFDPLSVTPPGILFSDNVRLAADSIACRPAGGSQVLRAGGLALETESKNLSMKIFEVIPQFSRDEFAQRSKGHTDWTRISIGGIACTGLDYAKLMNEKALSVSGVSLASADIASFKNRKVFRPPHTKPMLYETIQRLPVPTEIGTLTFGNIDITYDELSERGDTPGRVRITGGRGAAKNITNIVENHDRFLTVDLTATLMPDGKPGGGLMKATCLFPVSPSDDRWEITGSLGPTDMSAFNIAFEPLVNARITSGEIESLEFRMEGTLLRSHVDLTMAYSDLEVVFLKKHDHSHENRLLTSAGDLLVRRDNPGRDGRGKLREGEGGHTRDPERSMFNYIWHSLMPAIVKTVI